MKRLLLASCFALLPAVSWATCTPPLAVKDASAATVNMAVTNDANGNCESNVIVGGNTGSAPVQTATPANSSHAAGVSVGGKFTIPVARFNGGSGTITGLTWISTGGNTVQYLVRLWDKNPASTTCTDNSAFVENITDDQHLIAIPFTMTPQAPVVATGDTNTYATVTGLSFSYKNQDTSPSQNVYACVITVSTQPGSPSDANKAVYINLTGTQD